MITADAEEVLGVNSRGELAEAEALMQTRLRAKAMADGATLVAPETVFLSCDTKIGKDVVIEPHVVIGPRVTIEDNVTIRELLPHRGGTARRGRDGRALRPAPARRRTSPATPMSAISSRSSRPRSARGPRSTTSLISAMPASAPRANVGAGTITCNYDGFDKHRTEIGAGAFIGSNSSLVAPVKIGEGAYVGSGSVISKDVAADALALTRAPQEERQGWAAKMRERRGRRPKAGGNKRT